MGKEQRGVALVNPSGTITKSISITSGGSSRVLASNVNSATFYSDGKTLAMSFTVAIGSNQITLSGSAMSRRTVVNN